MSNHIPSDLDLPTRRVANETKPATRTTEFVAYILAVVGVLAAAGLIDGFDAARGWLFVSILTVGYMVSRGLAKAGSRAYFDDQR